MFKSIIVAAMIMVAGVAAPVANALPSCGYSPEDLVRMTIKLNDSGMSMDDAAHKVVYDVYYNCSDYASIFNSYNNTYGG
jgi:hypothetical protein